MAVGTNAIVTNMFAYCKQYTNAFAISLDFHYSWAMTERTDRWRDSPEAKQLREELREEARRLREELRAEWQHQMAQQTELLRAQREEREAQRRGPGRPRGHLSREAIVDVAMRIMERKGLDKVTMRAVAHELNTGPASIYAHVRSMAELHGHMLDKIIGRIDFSRGELPWDERVITLLRDVSEELLRFPDLARSALEVRPMGENTFRFADFFMGLLAEGGIPPRNRALGLDLLMLWTMGGAAERAADSQSDSGFDEAIEVFSTAVADAQRYPNLHDVRDDIFAGTSEGRFEWGVRSLLAGIAATPFPQD